MKASVFDHYSFRARLQPAFLALVPLAVSVMAWAQPGTKWVTALWSLLGAAGFTVFLANVARNRGKSIEPKLWESWGGTPTTQLLRHRGEANPALRERWHQQLAKLLGRPMPTPEEEAENPNAADALYEAGTRLLIGKTYDAKSYPFVYRDNVNYGFCRNLYGRLMGEAEPCCHQRGSHQIQPANCHRIDSPAAALPPAVGAFFDHVLKKVILHAEGEQLLPVRFRKGQQRCVEFTVHRRLPSETQSGFARFSFIVLITINTRFLAMC